MQTKFITKNKISRIKSLEDNIMSHNSMAAFFSDTDISTLKEQAAQCNNVLSLVVNNEGKYVAKFTERHMIHDTTHTASTTDTKDFWMHMGEHPDYTLSTKNKDWEDNKDSVEIHCWDCDIQRPLDVAIDEDFRKECLDKAELFKNRKTESPVETPHSFREWQDSDRLLYLPDYYYQHRNVGSIIREMVYSISNLSFNEHNYYWNKYLLSDTLDEAFLAAFMNAWYYYFLPDPDEIDKVKKTFLKWSLDGVNNCKRVRAVIANILEDLRVKAIEENAYVQ